MITEHVLERINSRIREAEYTIPMATVDTMQNKYKYGKFYVRIGKLDKRIDNPSSHGDCITLVIIDGNAITAMLSEQWQRWHDGKLVFELQ
jgi:hypothetical protein